jgi:hypothetical protein
MNRQELNQNLPILALFAALIFGLYFRFFPILQADFPLNDGGFFVMLTEELLESNFSLPDFSSYNLFQIPYAYPPLGFYLAAFFARITTLDVLDIFRFLPAVISWLTIPIFYLAAKKMLKSPTSLSIAVFIFAVIPRSWFWMIMGGGMTRSLGVMSSILTIYFGYQLFTQQKHLIPTILSFTLTVLSHPEALIFSALNLCLLFLFYNRTRNGFTQLTLVGLGAMVASSPWWITVATRHGFDPFMAASQTSGISASFINHIFLFNLTDEPSPALFATLAVLGAFYCFSQKDYFLPISAITTIILLPRSGPNYMIAVIAMLAALALTEIVFPGLALIQTKLEPANFESPPLIGTLSKAFLVYLFLNLLFSATIVTSEPTTTLRALTVGDLEAMQWVSLNTPPGSRFLVLSDTDWWKDSTGEWFPYLSERQALNTLQGSEWLPAEGFNQILTWRKYSQQCLSQSIECLNQAQIRYEIPYNYVYLVRQTEVNPLTNTKAIELELRKHQEYDLVYEGSTGLVFSWQP